MIQKAFDDLRQISAIGIYWADVQKEGFNPITKQPVTTTRRELQINYELPLGEEYARMVAAFVE